MMSPSRRQEEDRTPAQETWASSETDPSRCFLTSQRNKEISTLIWWQTGREPPNQNQPEGDNQMKTPVYLKHTVNCLWLSTASSLPPPRCPLRSSQAFWKVWACRNRWLASSISPPWCYQPGLRLPPSHPDPSSCTAGFFFGLASAPVSVCVSLSRALSLCIPSFLLWSQFTEPLYDKQFLLDHVLKKSRKGMYSTYTHIQITQMENVVSLSEVKQTCISVL